jgi:hypothetical protein
MIDRKPAQASDWKTEPMPDVHVRLQLEGAFTDEAFRLIALGVIPGSMEDKWFVYYEPPWLNLYRSWTGYCIYRVRCDPGDGEVKVVEAIVNREPQQYSQADGEREVELLETLLLSIIERQARGRAIDYGGRIQLKGIAQ